jgi:Xaa-Pro aminopeptidase
MVLTVEPGIYIPEFGGVRIEDDIVVSPDGHIQLTQSPKELVEIPLS